MNEREHQFINSFDCCFPYADTEQARRLIDEAITISSNAVFCILYELAIPPRSADVTPMQLHQHLSYLKSKFTHPLANVVIGLVGRVIYGQQISVEEAIAIMWKIADFRGEYSALIIASAVCDDVYDEAETAYDEICQSWEHMSIR